MEELQEQVEQLLKECKIPQLKHIAGHLNLPTELPRRELRRSIEDAIHHECDDKLAMCRDLIPNMPAELGPKLESICTEYMSKTGSKVKGRCYILNNYEFALNDNLHGYEKDAKMIRHTFGSLLNFDVREEKNATTERMNEIIQEWCMLEELEFADNDCVVVFILTHGLEHGVLLGSDDGQIHVDDIISKFHDCEKLKHAHKLFFIQACRGKLSPVCNKFKKCGVRFSLKFQDTFIYYCTGEGYASFVGDTGSIFISKLCEVLEDNSGQCKLWELSTMVNEKVSQTVIQHDLQYAAQSPEAVYTLRSDFSFREVTTRGLNPVGCIKLKKKNPCFIITNTKCATHTIQCKHFKNYKQIAGLAFKKLNFQVYENDNFVGEEISEFFSDVNKTQRFADVECFVCVVVSCGGESSRKPIIYGADGRFYGIDQMVRKVTGNVDLAGKPKIFYMILNRCDRESFRKAGEPDSAPNVRAQGNDTFVYYVIIEEGDKSHSPFIDELTQNLLEFSGDHLGDIVFKVNEEMSKQNAKVPEACSTLTKLVYMGDNKIDSGDVETTTSAGDVSDEVVGKGKAETSTQNEEAIEELQYVIELLRLNQTSQSKEGLQNVIESMQQNQMTSGMVKNVTMQVEINKNVKETTTRTNPKRFCFVLNNYQFVSYKLQGYVKDAEKIRQTFSSLNFFVLEKTNATAVEMREIIQEWCEFEFSGIECVAVFLLSNGMEHGKLFGRNGMIINVEEIISTFCSCEQLKGVPKLFFIQASRGDITPHTVVHNKFEMAGVRFDKKFQDTLVYYCTGEGYPGFVHDTKGSIFIDALCYVLEKYSGQCKLWELVTKVNENVSANVIQHDNRYVAQCPEAVYTLRSDFSFCEMATVGINTIQGCAITQTCPVRCMEVKKKNPCYILTNTNCSKHTTQCKFFKNYKQIAAQTFEDLNFEVYEQDDLSCEGTLQLFSSVKKANFAEVECFVCVILSCGGLNGYKPIVYGADGIWYSINTMMRKVNRNRDLVGKPKIYFMVVNRCDRESFREAAGAAGDPISEAADTFVYYIIIDDDAYSPFIDTLSQKLLEFSEKKYHLGDIIFQVNEEMHEEKAGIPEAVSTLTSLVYFAGNKDEELENIAGNKVEVLVDIRSA